MKTKFILLAGIVLGGISWAITPLVSESFEPFDSETAFKIGQVLTCTFTAYIGYKTNYKKLLVAVLGLYIGLNIYPYVFGGSEHRAWALLGLLSSTALCLFPLISGFLAIGFRKINMAVKSTKAP